MDSIQSDHMIPIPVSFKGRRGAVPSHVRHTHAYTHTSRHATTHEHTCLNTQPPYPLKVTMELLWCVAVCCSVVAVCCGVLQCGVVCCSVSQRVAVCCSLLKVAMELCPHTGDTHT